MTRRLRVALLGAALALAGLAAGPPLVSAITATLFTTSTLEHSVKVLNDGIHFKTKDPTDVHVQEARFAPGDAVDWHNHPGFALIAVKAGTMTFYDPDCTTHEVGPGKAFVETGGPTKAVNAGHRGALLRDLRGPAGLTLNRADRPPTVRARQVSQEGVHER